ncbi:putative 40S ribosomal protein S4-3 [Cocos nucifera]|uniref:Putative 40S ribosomal protein S4-3 n=1 Tax=Cocos nucifera TaxID=13894 RepID=A0A8K0HW60_COCNU|nr:putative 40S ribosomal protein S4-3 [Cocos nucifera]
MLRLATRSSKTTSMCRFMIAKPGIGVQSSTTMGSRRKKGGPCWPPKIFFLFLYSSMESPVPTLDLTFTPPHQDGSMSSRRIICPAPVKQTEIYVSEFDAKRQLFCNLAIFDFPDSGNARGLKKHLKRLNAPKHWMLDKLGGAFAPKPSSGPHKARECLPLILILRNRLKYALTYREVIAILMQRHVLVDGKVRTDKTYPAGFMDVVSIPKTNENFRLLYDTKGRFRLHSIRDEEAKFKLCKVRSVQFGQKGIPYLNTYDGRTIRYPDPLIKANDTIKLDLETNKIVDFIKFDVGNVVMVTGGRNRGRVGVIKNREKHKGSFETIHLQDATGHEFATRLGNVFTIGKGTKPWVSLPKGKGIKLSIIEEARKRLAASGAAATA